MHLGDARGATDKDDVMQEDWFNKVTMVAAPAEYVRLVGKYEEDEDGKRVQTDVIIDPEKLDERVELAHAVLQWCAGHRLSLSEANHAAVEKQRRARDMDIIASQTVNPKPRVSRAVIGVVLALILATTLAASSGLALDAASVVAEMAAACGLTEANVRWFVRVIVVGGTMGISGAVYCALTFGIATGVVYLLFKRRS